MWPAAYAFLRTYAVYITWPVAAVVGFVGYNIERAIRANRADDKKVWRSQSIEEERNERRLHENENKDCADVDSLKLKKDIPKTIFGKNT